MPRTPPSAGNTATPPPQATGWKRVLLRVLAVVALGVALVGVVTPGLPTTEFVLLSAWAAARSSPRLHAWILRHRVLGPLLANWQAGKLPRRAKWAATCTMTLAGTFSAIAIPHRPSAVIVVSIMACVLAWLWTRPEP
ncbi:MAG TPA: DUF454 domain-containing protein [Stenotrophomonas sp.]|nr:DUF454 domain-containing protein [Stenotrophomonas sp.]